jgi:membrane-associated phospholipid phosphatase
MSRGLGAVELLDGLPDAAVVVAALATQLGDTWFLFAATGGLFLVGLRRRSSVSPADGAVLFALVVAASSLTTVLKHALGLARPPGAATAATPAWLPPAAATAYESAVTAAGYGFPSGHALTATAVYGGAALALAICDRGRRLLIAGTAIALVAASRVVIGVHYAVDVVVGVAVGAAFLAGTLRLADGRPTRALALATGLAALSFAVQGTDAAAIGVVGTAVALAAWVGVDRFANRRRAAADG